MMGKENWPLIVLFFLIIGSIAAGIIAANEHSNMVKHCRDTCDPYRPLPYYDDHYCLCDATRILRWRINE